MNPSAATHVRARIMEQGGRFLGLVSMGEVMWGNDRSARSIKRSMNPKKQFAIHESGYLEQCELAAFFERSGIGCRILQAL